MVAPLLIAAGVQAATGIIGGVIARAAARARGAYFSELQLEQARASNFWMKRKIASETGAAISASASHGVALEGSPIDMIMNENFNAQIQRTIQMQTARVQAEQTKISGATAGANALQAGFGTAITAGTDYAKGLNDSRQAR